MSDLVEFLRARLAEDERIALAACYWRDYADCHPGGRPFKHDRWTRRYAAEDRLDNIVRTALPEEGQNLPGSSLDPIPDGWIKAPGSPSWPAPSRATPSSTSLITELWRRGSMSRQPGP